MCFPFSSHLWPLLLLCVCVHSVVLRSLRLLSTTTAILTDPSLVPEQAALAVTQGDLEAALERPLQPTTLDSTHHIWPLWTDSVETDLDPSTGHERAGEIIKRDSALSSEIINEWSLLNKTHNLQKECVENAQHYIELYFIFAVITITLYILTCHSRRRY